MIGKEHGEVTFGKNDDSDDGKWLAVCCIAHHVTKYRNETTTNEAIIGAMNGLSQPKVWKVRLIT